MNVIAQLKLNPTPAQADALRRTLEAGNAACNAISRTAFQTQTFHRYQLQSLVYHTIKADFGLSAQMVIRCLAKVADAYTRDTTKQHSFRRDGAIAFDDRILSWNTTNETVSIWSVDGRLKGIPYQAGERQRTYLHYRQGETETSRPIAMRSTIPENKLSTPDNDIRNCELPCNDGGASRQNAI